MSTTNVIGRKITGFEFPDGTDHLKWNTVLVPYIGRIGKVIGIDGSHVSVQFKNGSILSYPLSLIEQHLVPESGGERPRRKGIAVKMSDAAARDLAPRSYDGIKQFLPAEIYEEWAEDDDGNRLVMIVNAHESISSAWVQIEWNGFVDEKAMTIKEFGTSALIANSMGDRIAQVWGDLEKNATEHAQDFVNAEAYRVENERLRAALNRALDLLVDIDSTLFHHSHEVVGWHKNDAGEPMMNFVADFDMDAINEIKSALEHTTNKH